MTTALEGGEWSAARPGRTLPSGKTRYPLYRRLGGPPRPVWTAKNLAPPGFDPRTVQPVVSRYTYWATRPTCDIYITVKYTYIGLFKENQIFCNKYYILNASFKHDPLFYMRVLLLLRIREVPSSNRFLQSLSTSTSTIPWKWPRSLGPMYFVVR